MSFAVVLYQIAIATSIFTASILFGRRVGFVVAAAWLLWTVIMVFTAPLFILQVITIGLSLYGTKEFRTSPSFGKVRKALGITVGGIAALGLTFIGMAIYVDSRPSSWPASTIDPPEQVNVSRTESLFRQPETESAYELAVQSLERRYPQLNPSGGRFDPTLVDQVVSRRNQLIQQGVSMERAVVMAAEQILGGSGQSSSRSYRCGKNVFQDFPCESSR